MNLAFLLAALIQAAAVAYGLYLLSRQRSAATAWLWLLGAMLSMLAWRLVVILNAQPPLWFNLVIAIWGSTCMLLAMFQFGREIELRRRAEAERDRLLESERIARQAADRAARLKDEFLATLSHELRSPLAAILGWCSVLRHMLATNPRKDPGAALDTIERNARTQVRLVDDMLDITRLQAGSLHLNREVMSFDAAVRAAVLAIQPEAQAKSVALELGQMDAALIEGDVVRVQQIAANLLSNAVKFTPATGRVTISLRRLGGSAELRVADTGEGIEAAALPHIFERFRQGDSSVARRHGGLGLGLFIVADLVRLQGGSVGANSEGPGRGAVFTVRLPLASAPAAEPRPRESDTECLDGLRVLLIDDERDVREAVVNLLEQRGARVSARESGATIERDLADFDPDVLLIDIGMPIEDGYSLIRRIRQLPESAGGATPALSLTAHAREEDRAHALACGFQAHLPKPIDLARLSLALRAHARPGTDANRLASPEAGSSPA